MNKAILVWDGKTLRIPSPPMAEPASHQLQSSSNLDNLIELSGRACYDSVGSVKSRNTAEYHQHIKEVGHLSVQEHATFTVEYGRAFDYKSYHYYDEADILGCFVNRPGIWVGWTDDKYRLTVNIRTVREWERFGLWSTENKALGIQLKDVAKQLAPMAMFDWEPSGKVQLVKVVEPRTDDEVWASIYFFDMSRSCSHELVRHGDRTAVSQRSSRFCNENETKWAWHPLIYEYINNTHDSLNSLSRFMDYEYECREAYGDAVNKLEKYLVNKGVDKFTARKQARGAARGVLGNALATEVMFSASITQWKWMLYLRASRHADAEIRLAFNDVFRLLMEAFPDRFVGWSEQPAPDGIGTEVVPPSNWNTLPEEE